MKCTENLAQNSNHLYAICGTNFIQRYTSFLKIYRMLSGKMLPTMIKCTGKRTVKLYSLLEIHTKHGGFSSGELSTMKESSLQIHDEKDIKVPFVHVTIYFHHKSS